MSRQLVLDRLVALSGLVAGGLVAAGASLGDPYDPATSPDPTDSAALLAQALVANRAQARLGAYLTLAGAFFLIWFVARLSVHLRTAGHSREWLALVAFGGGLLTAAALLVDVGFGFAASELSGYGSDPQVARTLFLWGWNSAGLLAAPLGALMLATTAAAFQPGVFAVWFRWVSLLIVLALLGLSIGGTVGVVALVGILWVMVTSIALATRVGDPYPTSAPGRR